MPRRSSTSMAATATKTAITTTGPAPAPAPAPAPGRPELGLVCQTDDASLRFRTITQKRLRSLSVSEARTVLLALYRENLAALARVPGICAAIGTRLYRIPSSLLPFADIPLGGDLLDELADELAALGERIRAAGLRVVMHPEQFVVLSSDSPEVVANAITVLVMHGRILDALGLPASPWAAIEIHGGKGGRGPELIERIAALPDPVRRRLVLENDERAYGAEAILAVCQAAGVAMVFDAHHHLCFSKLPDFEHPSVAAMTTAAAQTWPDPSWQLCHISNGREDPLDRRHSDEIAVMPSAFAAVPWIEIEAKAKDRAIRRLQREWLPQLDPDR